MRVRTGLTPDAWRDEGPGVGRRTFTRYGVRGSTEAPTLSGQMVQGESERARDLRIQRESMRRRRAAQ